ncbi:MAG: hypothetical protein AAGG75_04665 [Bacteroidota bacterium]
MKERQQNIESWLSKLQQESWNLELLISGFSIFLLIQASQGLKSLAISYRGNFVTNGALESVPYLFIGILQIASYVLICNLIIHIFLRGFWIGAIGLRSVQDKVSYEKLKYSDFFVKKLQKRISTLDTLLIRLDTISSVIFSFTFLIIFMLISLFFWVVWITLIIITLDAGFNFLGESWAETLEPVLGITVLALLFLGVIYLIDTLSLGFFKKFHWVSRIYYPVYRLFGYFTLAGIYRAIYYNLISRFSKNYIRLFLIIYLSVIILVPFTKLDSFQFFPDTPGDTLLDREFYDNIRPKNDRITIASIPNQLIKDGYLPLFLSYDINDNDNIIRWCEDYTPSKENLFVSGIRIRSDGFTFNNPKVKEKDPEKLRDCLANYYSIYLNDSLYNQQEFFYYEHPNMGEKGLYTVLDIEGLSRGQNTVYVRAKNFDERDSLIESTFAQIPFWIDR